MARSIAFAKVPAYRDAMQIVAAGFWGAFFGTVALMLTGALFAYAQSRQRVALAAALSALTSAVFVVAYLGWLTASDSALEARLLAHVAVISATFLGLMLLHELGLLRGFGLARRVRWSVLVLAALVLGAGWLVSPRDALALSSIVAFCIGLSGLAVAARSAQRGDRLAWLAVVGVIFMLVAIAGLSWIALDRRGVPWVVHPLSALAGMAYLTSIEAMLWRRYSYLIELSQVLSQGPRYDPVTRMKSEAAIGSMVGLAFVHQQQHPARPLIFTAICIANLQALERMHGRVALNHALFVCGARLRRLVPGNVETARLFEDGFLLLERDAEDRQRAVQLARLAVARLSRPVVLNTSEDCRDLESSQTRWEPQVGVGMLVAAAHDNPSIVLSRVSQMARTALDYATRVAIYDEAQGRISELSPPRGDGPALIG